MKENKTLIVMLESTANYKIKIAGEGKMREVIKGCWRGVGAVEPATAPQKRQENTLISSFYIKKGGTCYF